MKSRGLFGTWEAILLLLVALVSPSAALAQYSPPSSNSPNATSPGTISNWGTIIAALIAAGGVIYQIRANKRKELDEQRRQREALQACLISDIKAILRVIDIAGIVDHMLARHFEPAREFPMAGGPRQEDYFVLYAAVAKNLGDLDKEVGVRATAFYVLLTGSRDVAESFKLLKESHQAHENVMSAISLTARIVLEMPEHVHRHGFIAIALSQRYGVQRSISVADLDTSEPFTGHIFRTWLFLIALRQHLTTKNNPSWDSLIDALQQPERAVSELKASLAQVKLTIVFPETESPDAMQEWIRRVRFLGTSAQAGS